MGLLGFDEPSVRLLFSAKTDATRPHTPHLSDEGQLTEAEGEPSPGGSFVLRSLSTWWFEAMTMPKRNFTVILARLDASALRQPS